MFTGIIETIGKVISLKKQKNLLYFSVLIASKGFIKNLLLGASVSNNGCCLSVVKIKDYTLDFEVIKETLYCTNLNLIQIGDYLNLERSKKFCDEINGHIVLGHISTTAKIISILILEKNIKVMELQLNCINYMKYIIEKGSICINGISLTIGSVTKNTFFVHLIPDTLFRTNINRNKINDIVNIEVDCYTKIIVDTTERFLNTHHR